MASNLGSAVTPTGHQAYSDLLNTEQQNRAMGQSAYQNMQDRGIQQQQFAQQSAMQQQAMDQQQANQQQEFAQNQQRMNMAQGQFDAGLQEAQRQREHEMGREDLAYERGSKLQESQQNFQAAQAEALQKWQQKQIEQAHAYELQLEKLSAMREMARDKGQNEVVERITNQMIATRKERSKKAMTASLSSRLLGKSQREIAAIAGQLRDELGRKVSAEQQNQALAAKFGGSFLSRLDEEDRKASLAKFQDFHSRQTAYGIDSFNPLSANFGDVGAAISTGALDGVEWLDLDPTTFSRVTGFGGNTTTQAGAVSGYVDPATMSETIKGRLIEGTVQQLNEMGLRNFNPDAARKLVGLAMSGGSKAEIAQLSTQAGIPTSTLKYLFDAAARGHEATSSNTRYQRLMEADARYRQEAGYQQNDLKVMAIAKAKEAYGAKSKYLRMAANSFDDMDLNDYNAGIEVLGEIQRTGEMSGLAAGRLGKIGLGAEAGRLGCLIAQIPGAKQQAEEAAYGLGDVAEEEQTLQALAPLMLARSQRGGDEAYLKMLDELMGQYGPQAGTNE
jgi:hypothetical protein